MAELCFGDLQFSASSANLLGSDGSGRGVFKGTFKGQPVAVKQFLVNSTDSQISGHQDEQHWEKLLKFRDNNLVQYLQCRIEDDVRYLVMELCQGSMLDYCRKTLDESVASYVKAIDVMWQITCGLDYLHRQKIHHGDLKLENVLFRKRDSKSKRVVVKLAGYGCKDAKTDLFHLGCLFYSAATKEEAEPNGSVPVDSLTEIDVNHRELALDLISLLVCGCLPDSVVEAGTILRHPLFTRCTDEGRSRLIEDSLDDKMGLIWNDKEKMQKWLESMDEGKFPEEDFDDFKDILIESETKDTHRIVREAFKITPQLFSEYVWHTAIGSGEKRIPVPKSDSKPYSIELQEELGKGTYGTVYKCDYTAGNGNVFPAACKKCKPKPEAEEVFSREIETLRKLNHLFIVRYLDAVEKDSAKFIVMELCEGSLKEYIEGKLESIPKDSLDEKILVGQITLGLAYIHSEGIIHKDLKLENILLKRYSPRLVLAKIADFGFAKELKPGKSEFSETEHPGTETYMAPELLSAPDGAYPASFPSDVYALGITIARIVLKGKHPFSSNKFRRQLFIFHGLVSLNLQGLSWDLIDLILKLTDKDPGKRPEMFLVLRHPYFVLTNDRTKRHFVDLFWNNFQYLTIGTNGKRKKQMRKIFNYRNFREWYETLSRDKQNTTEDMEQMKKTLKLFSSVLGCEVKADTLYPTKEYEQTIKEAIASEYDVNVGNKITQMNGIHSYFRGLSRYRLYKLIQRTPNLLVPYFWSHLQELENESLSSFVSFLTSESQKSASRKGRESRKRKLSEAIETLQNRHKIISELEWISLHYDDEDLVDELWNIKYRGNYEESSEIVVDNIDTMAKCNVSEQVWSDLLDNFGNEFGSTLLPQAAQCYAPNAPKVTDMILHRWDEATIKEKTPSVDVAVLIAACNEGDWAAKIMQVLLKHGGHPNVVNSDGYTPVHCAAINESHSAPEIIRLLLQYGANPNTPSIPDGITPVHMAAFNQGDYAPEILKQLLDSGGTCNAVEKINLFEPIHYATVNSGDSAVQLLDFLLEKRGIDVICGKYGETLLHFVIRNEGDGGPKILKKLLESGINPNVVDKRNWTPLHLASRSLNIENQNIALMRDLLENGGDPNAVDEDGRTPVHYAASNEGEHGNEKLKILLEYEGNVSIKDKNGQTPLHYAVFGNGNFGTETRENTRSDEAEQNIATRNNQINVQLILDNGGNPNAQDIFGYSPVHIAVIQNELDILQLLLKKGGNPNLLDKEQCAPIHFAADSVSETAPEMMKILLEYGGNANLNGGEEGVTPLHLAAKNLGNSGNHGLQLTEILLEHGGNSNVQDNLGRSPVHIVAAINECNVGLEILKLLLNKGGDPNLLDKEERCSPLHCAANGHKERGPEKIKILLEYGGDPNLKGGEKVVTPLHIACMNSEIHGPTITRILLENGANPNALDFHKRTPLHLAIQQKEDDQLRLETIKLLLEKGANPNAGDKEGRTPVHYVVKNNRSNSLKMLKLLLENGGNILQKGNNGASPYLEATQKGNKQYCHPEVKKCIVRTYRKMK